MADDFAVSVAAWVEKAKGRSEEAFRAIALDLTARVKDLTPVKTGYLRANWVDLRNDEVAPKPGQEAKVGSAIAQAKLGDVIHVVNPVEYARRVEYGFTGQDSSGRTFNQPPRGMVAQTVAEAPAIAARAIARINRS